MRFDAVINRFVYEAKYFNKLFVHGSGEQTRPFISIFDVVEVIRHSILGELPSSVYNAFDENMKVIDVVRALQEILPELEIQYLNHHVPHGSLRLKKIR